MSIAITSQQKYHFQRLAVLWLAVRGVDAPGHALTLRSEAAGEEDATLLFQVEGAIWTIELQVKGSVEDITIEGFAEWLTHFPERASTNFLLERVGADPFRVALFIASGRSNDAMRVFSRPLAPQSLPPAPSAPPRASLDVLKNALATSWQQRDPTLLSLARRTHCDTLFTSTSTPTLREWMKRVLLFERVDTETLVSQLSGVLRQAWHVPELSIADAIDNCCNVIRKHLGGGIDIATKIRETLAGYSAARIFPWPASLYLKRGDEEALESTLADSQVLLLCGPPLCGKTHTARWIGQRLQDQGYRCEEFQQEVAAAVQFLSSPQGESRLAIVHDPFGSIEHSANSSANRRLLEQLVRDLSARPHRKLIVTSQDNALKYFGPSDTWSLGHIHWTDLGPTSAARTRALWLSIANGLELDPTLVAGLETALSGVELEAGEVALLAHSSLDASAIPSRSEAVQLARTGAKQLAALLADDTELSRALVLMYACATTTSPASLADLAFVASTSGDIPGKVAASSIRSYALGSLDSEPPPTFPLYPGAPSMVVDELRISLSKLEKRGLLQRAPHWRFAHPIYEEAARILAHHALAELPLTRAVQCLSVDVAMCALTRASQLLTQDSTLENQCVAVFLAGTESLFPRVADAALDLLIRAPRSSRLAPDLADTALRLYSSRLNLLWHNGEPWYDQRTTRPMLQLYYSESMSDDELAAKLPEVDRTSSASSEVLYHAVRHGLRGNPLSEVICNLLLTSHIAIIRGMAYEYIFRASPALAQRALTRLRDDSSPTVLRHLTRVVMSADVAIAGEVRSDTVKALLHTATTHGICGMAVLVLSRAGGDEFSYRKVAWDAWARMASVCLDHLPVSWRFNVVEFFSAAESAIRAVQSGVAVELFRVWVNWAIRRSQVSEIDDYELAVTAVSFSNDHILPSDRVAALTSLLSVQNTGTRACVVASYINYWSEATQEERTTILAALTGHQRDARWLRAFAASREEVPTDIAVTLGLPPDAYTREGSRFAQAFPSGLLFDTLSVYCGHPQPLWWYGRHHTNSHLWHPTIFAIATTDTYEIPLRRLALREICGMAAYGKSEKEAKAAWHETIRGANDALLDVQFEVLLRETACNTGARLKSLWSSLFRARSTIPDRWLHAIKGCLEAICLSDNLLAVLDDRVSNFLTPFLAEELRLLQSFGEYAKSERSWSGSAGDVFRLLVGQPDVPIWRLNLTHDAVRSAIVAAGRQPRAFPVVEAAWERYTRVARETTESLDDQFVLPDWDFPSHHP